jgi:hypothetical protein
MDSWVCFLANQTPYPPVSLSCSKSIFSSFGEKKVWDEIQILGQISSLTGNPTGNSTENFWFRPTIGPDKLSQAQTCFWAGLVYSRFQVRFKLEISGSILGSTGISTENFWLDFRSNREFNRKSQFRPKWSFSPHGL